MYYLLHDSFKAVMIHYTVGRTVQFFGLDKNITKKISIIQLYRLVYDLFEKWRTTIFH